MLLELGFFGVMSSCTQSGPKALSNDNTVLQALYTRHQLHHTCVMQALECITEASAVKPSQKPANTKH